MAEPAKDEHPIAYIEAGKPVYRASACGGCIRALVAARLGFDPVEAPEFLARAAEAGSALENVMIEELQASRISVHSRQKEIEIEAPAWVIRGHIDGIAETEQGPHVAEFKTMSGRRFATWKRHGFAAFPRYAAQLSAYHHALNLPILFMAMNRDSGETDMLRLPTPPIPFAEVRQKLNTAEVWARKGRLPACDYERGSIERRVCPYAYLCGGEDAKEEQRASGVTIQWDEVAVREWAKRYVAAREQEMAAAALKDEARATLLDLVGVGRKVQALGYTVSVVVRERHGYDTKRLEADFGEKLAPYRTSTEYTAVTVQPPKGDET